MQKEFLKNIYLLLFINIIIKPIYILGIDVQVQNQVGDSEYGIYFAIFDFCFLFQVILDAGIQNYNSITVSQNRKTVAEQFAFVLGTKLLLIVLFFAAVFCFAFIFGYPKTYYKVIVLMAMIMSAQSLFLYFRSHFPALGLFKYENWLSALDKILMIFIIGFSIYIAKNISIINFMYGQLLAFGIAILVSIVLLRNKFRLSIEIDFSKSIALIKKSIPFALVFILMTLYTRMDGVMLERLIPDEGVSAGRYAKGFRLMDAANMIGYLFSVFLLPMFAKIIGDKKNPTQLTMTALKVQLTLALMISMSCWFYAKDILESKFLYDTVTAESINAFKFLMVGFIAMALSYIFGSLITASAKLKTLNLIFVFGIMINWSLNLYLIPRYQAVGAALATLITQFFVFFGQFILATSRFKLKYDLGFIWRVLLLVGIYFAVIYVLDEYLSIYWLLEVILFFMICIGISILLGFLRFSNSLRA